MCIFVYLCDFIYTTKNSFGNEGIVPKATLTLTIPIWMFYEKSSRPRKRPIILAGNRSTYIFLEVFEDRKPPEPSQKVIWAILLKAEKIQIINLRLKTFLFNKLNIFYFNAIFVKRLTFK